MDISGSFKSSHEDEADVPGVGSDDVLAEAAGVALEVVDDVVAAAVEVDGVGAVSIASSSSSSSFFILWRYLVSIKIKFGIT